MVKNQGMPANIRLDVASMWAHGPCSSQLGRQHNVSENKFPLLTSCRSRRARVQRERFRLLYPGHHSVVWRWMLLLIHRRCRRVTTVDIYRLHWWWWWGLMMHNHYLLWRWRRVDHCTCVPMSVCRTARTLATQRPVVLCLAFMSWYSASSAAAAAQHRLVPAHKARHARNPRSSFDDMLCYPGTIRARSS